MKFGVFLPLHWLDMRQPVDELYSDAVEVAVAADELGYDVVWLAEHHFINFICSPSPFTLAAQIACRTRQIRIGTAVAVLPFYHPLRAIGDAAVTDILSEGRLEFGIGRGAFPYEFSKYGQDVESARSAFYEGVDVVRRMWASESAISHHGEHWQFDETRVLPPPLQRPHPPLWIAGQTAPTIEWAVKEGMNVLNSPWRDAFSRVEEVAKVHRDARAKYGADPRQTRLGISRMAFIGETDEQVRRQVPYVARNHEMLVRLHKGSAEVINGEVVGAVGASDGDGKTQHRFGWEAAPRTYSEEEIQQNLIFGTPDNVRKAVQQYDDLGIDHLMLYMAFGEPHEDVMRSLRLFATEVMPAFADVRR